MKFEFKRLSKSEIKAKNIQLKKIQSVNRERITLYSVGGRGSGGRRKKKPTDPHLW